MKKEDRLQLITIHQDLLIILIENFLRPKENLLLFFFLKKKEKNENKAKRLYHQSDRKSTRQKELNVHAYHDNK